MSAHLLTRHSIGVRDFLAGNLLAGAFSFGGRSARRWRGRFSRRESAMESGTAEKPKPDGGFGGSVIAAIIQGYTREAIAKVRRHPLKPHGKDVSRTEGAGLLGQRCKPSECNDSLTGRGRMDHPASQKLMRLCSGFTRGDAHRNRALIWRDVHVADWLPGGLTHNAEIGQSISGGGGLRSGSLWVRKRHRLNRPHARG